MDLAAGAVGAVAGLLLHGKAKLVRLDTGGGDSGGGGLGGALSAVGSAVAAALPIPGLGPEDKDSEITFMFNPTEYRISQTASITHSASVFDPGGHIEYTGTSGMTVSMQLFFDDFASAKGDVTPKISKLLSWQYPDKKKQVGPPFVKFEWGNKQLQNFKGVITSLNVSYTLFGKDGTPIQAKVDLTLDGNIDPVPGTNPTSHATDMRRVHSVVEGETIAMIAFAELGRSGYWRAIAEANGIDDPLRIRAGQFLLIPSAADAARNS
jgi:Contractile injection system tube protein/LysM domain